MSNRKRYLVLCVILALFIAAVVAVPTAANAHGFDRRWICVAHYESTHRWYYNGSSGYDGGLQFHPDTWRQYTGSSAPDYAWQATPRFQVEVARRVVYKGFYRHPPQGRQAFTGLRYCP